MHLENQAALITGASRGLGAALTRQLGARGVRVAALARHHEPLAEVVAQVRQAGGQAHALVGDIADKTATYRIAGSAAELVGSVDILIHNASTLGPTPLKLLLDTECEDLSEVLEVNLVGPFRLSKAVAGSMALREKGVIVHVSSDAAVQAYPRWGAYSVSKAASDHLARLLAAELGEHGVRVFSVDPGEMDTEMHAAAIPDADRASLSSPDQVAARIVDMLVHVEDIANGARLEATQWPPLS
ncbi:MAG TPA: SDR family oxidoreductase [Polyangiaceae bacterium]|jgi:NAD(P)-dependent dehydrogenase (short-subunit alcohol dehydrogenase family)